MAFSFGKGYWKNIKEGLEREWVISNGIGGYCGSSIINSLGRMHHGYLIASLHPPVERYCVLSKTDETLITDNHKYSFACNYREKESDNGHEYLQNFTMDELPNFTYEAAGTFVKKTLAMEREKNTVAIGYDIMCGPAAKELVITPFFTYREHSNTTKRKDLEFAVNLQSDRIHLTPKANEDIDICMYCDQGEIKNSKRKYSGRVMLQTEIETGGCKYIESLTAYEIHVPLKPFERKKISVICTIEKDFEKDAFKTIKAQRDRLKKIKAKSGYEDEFLQALVQTSDNFIVRRESSGLKTILAGYPWFSDWGRDTMIAFNGLCLCTKRYDDAMSILNSFAKYEKDGLVPNVFPDGGSAPMYNTADASLWYINAVYSLLKASGRKKDYDEIEKNIFPVMEHIIYYYEHGTENSIYMEEDGLIHAGSGIDQVTWMDVRVGNWVVTPRHGKPVEINALWYNALRIMEQLSKKYKKDSDKYAEMAEKAKESFNKEFWNDKEQCLYDVVDKEVDSKVRPNQVYAVSLPFPVVQGEKAKLVVSKVLEKLYDTYGLRTLDFDDPEYKPFYIGKLHDRDAAYHQGTCWAYPLGALITAYVKAFGTSKENLEYAKKLAEPLKDHLRDGCIGGIAEIFDGDGPNISRGCYNQAWSVGEILRAVSEIYGEV